MIQPPVVYIQSTINIPKRCLPALSLVARCLLFQAIPYMPVHTNINPVVCCCCVYICGPVASLNGQQLLFVRIIRTRLFQRFRQPIRVQLSQPLSLTLSCPCLAGDDYTSSLGRSTHRLFYLPLPFWTVSIFSLFSSTLIFPSDAHWREFSEVEFWLKWC